MFSGRQVAIIIRNKAIKHLFPCPLQRSSVHVTGRVFVHCVRPKRHIFSPGVEADHAQENRAGGCDGNSLCPTLDHARHRTPARLCEAMPFVPGRLRLRGGLAAWSKERGVECDLVGTSRKRGENTRSIRPLYVLSIIAASDHGMDVFDDAGEPVSAPNQHRCDRGRVSPMSGLASSSASRRKASAMPSSSSSRTDGRDRSR